MSTSTPRSPPLDTEACLWWGVAAAHVASFPARNLANSLWGLAKLSHHPGAPLLQALADEALNKLSGFNAQNLANTLWAFANLGAATA